MSNKNPKKTSTNTGKGNPSKSIGPVRIPPKKTRLRPESDSKSDRPE